MDFVRDDELFEGDMLGAQALHEIDCLAERHVAIVVAVDQQHRRFPGVHVGIRRRFPREFYGSVFVGWLRGHAAEIRTLRQEDAPVMDAMEIDSGFEEIRIFREAHGDRKSTRLNSSHPSISYAVFCLKKKTKKKKQ